jgi:hypothetical protein
MKSIQLGGVLVKGKKELPPKFTGPARYRGAKRIEQPGCLVNLGGTASKSAPRPIGMRALFVFLQADILRKGARWHVGHEMD